DIGAKQFADIYAQTIAYGMFAARLHDKSLDTFTRQEAAELIPKTNPFLKNLFQYIAGYNLDERIDWIVNDLADLFRATDIAAILKNFGKVRKSQDPIVHFYESFLSEYDPKLRKDLGVWLTPEPVVDFIVRAVDEALKTEFSLPLGIGDTTKTSVAFDIQGKKQLRDVHKVQLLDPATGTGTFLAKVIGLIHKSFESQAGIWSGYVENHLLPRMNAFERQMAPYAIAHLKIDTLLEETGYVPDVPKRLQIYLTDSLEEYHPETGTLFTTWLSREANEANHVKRDTPVMVVLGNPPYKGESKNKGKWIMSLMEDYKKEPGGKVKLKEKNPKWINDDYVKFLRFAQYFIEKNGSGALAFINPHGFLDNPTFRGIRWHLLRTYDKLFVFDLHGNLKKGRVAEDGSPDENVFDIKDQGVSINIFVKTGKKQAGALGEMFHFEMLGRRSKKFQFLLENSLTSIAWTPLTPSAPMFYMVPTDDGGEQRMRSFKITELFKVQSMGVTSGDDKKLVAFTKDQLKERFPESRTISPISFRPFDERFINYDPSALARAREELMRHLKGRDNLAFTTMRRGRAEISVTPLVARGIVDKGILSSVDNANVFPLYVYPENADQHTLEARNERTANLSETIVAEIAKATGLTFVSEQSQDGATFAPCDVLDYTYAILHSPRYREAHREELQRDFPFVPYPTDKEEFLQLVRLGGQLRQVHLLESPTVNRFITGYPITGTNRVEKPVWKPQPVPMNAPNPPSDTVGDVFINPMQYFSNVPKAA
ncbi:MAG: N-6 DNA methylase, partial [Acidobacteria bacterium]|nr:N-6 DNA methylase [Acidobacteriota bacterium]